MTASITLHVYFNPLFKNQSLEKGENNRRELSKILSCKSAKIPYKSRVFGVWLSNNEYKFQDRLVMTTSITLRVFNFIKNRNPSQGKLRENCEKRFSQSAFEDAKNPIKSRVFKKLHKQTKEVFKTASL